MSKTGRKLTEDHKAAILEGRRQTRVFNQYVKALSQSSPRFGSGLSIEKRKELDDLIHDKHTSPMERADALLILQAADAVAEFDIETLEGQFKQIAPELCARKGYNRKVLKELGIPARVLNEAGIH